MSFHDSAGRDSLPADPFSSGAKPLANSGTFDNLAIAFPASCSVWIGRAVLAALLLMPGARSFADGGNPFELTTTIATSWQGYLKTVAIAVAGLGGTVVIVMAMFGVLRLRWAIQIGGGLIALTGLAWLIASLQGNG